MARFRKVDPRIWNDQKFAALSNSGKLLFFMLLTHPNMTALGAMRGTASGLAEELGWSPEAFREAFQEASLMGMAEHDPKACLIALPNFIRYNAPESPNVVRAWIGALDLLPECSLKTRVVARAKAFAEGMGKGFGKAFAEVFGKAMPNPESEPEPEQEQEKKSPQPPSGGRQAISFKAWITNLREVGEKPIPEGDPIFSYCETVGIPHEYLSLHWFRFKARYLNVAKRQRDWRAHFRDSVRGNWFGVWVLREGQQAMLTTVGEQARREFEAEHREAA